MENLPPPGAHTQNPGIPTVRLTSRLYGVDLARFLAIAGMVIAHLAGSRWDEYWLRVPTDGYPSALFAVLGGFGVTFAARRYLRAGRSAAAAIACAVRGAVIIAIGLLLELLPPHPIVVVLVPFGTAIMLAALVLRAPTWLLATLAALLAVAAPPLLAWRNGPGALMPLAPAELATTPFLTGHYPVITWFTYLLAGMVMARLVLGPQKRRLPPAPGQLMIFGLLAAGTSRITANLFLALAPLPQRSSQSAVSFGELYRLANGYPVLGGWRSYFVPAAHSGSLVDVVGSVGVAAMVIGACLLVARNWQSMRPSGTLGARAVPAALRPLVGAGSAPLTSYVAHLLMTVTAMAVAGGGFEVFFNPGAPAYIKYWVFWQLAAIVAIGAVVAQTGRRGPLEALVSNIARKGADTLAPATPSQIASAREPAPTGPYPAPTRTYPTPTGTYPAPSETYLVPTGTYPAPPWPTSAQPPAGPFRAPPAPPVRDQRFAPPSRPQGRHWAPAPTDPGSPAANQPPAPRTAQTLNGRQTPP